MFPAPLETSWTSCLCGLWRAQPPPAVCVCWTCCWSRNVQIWNLSFESSGSMPALVKAAESGNPDVLLWWATKYIPGELMFTADLALVAADNGRLNILQWMEGKGWSEYLFSRRVISNHANVVQWYHTRKIRVAVSMDAAAKSRTWSS